tara:strand:- start:42 stop:422 length:381 start_codon:yes stop_codon:yes gene_type:complete
MKNKYTISKALVDTTKLGIKGIKLGFIGLGYGMGVANKIADSALEATKDGISLSKKEQSDESQDSSPIDTQQPIEDVRKDLFDKYMEQNPEGSWELFQEEYHYLFHPDELTLKENGETKEMYRDIK